MTASRESVYDVETILDKVIDDKESGFFFVDHLLTVEELNYLVFQLRNELIGNYAFELIDIASEEESSPINNELVNPFSFLMITLTQLNEKPQ